MNIKFYLLYIKVILLVFSSLTNSPNANGQCNTILVQGDTYEIKIELESTRVLVTNGGCPGWGFNYQTEIAYKITTTGTNPNLYTLQGNINCGGTNSFFNLPNSGGSGNILSANASRNNCNNFPPTPENMSCNGMTITIHGRGIPNQNISVTCGFSILPVEILYLHATFSQENRTSTISWGTAKEWENSHFEIERAINNVNAFSKIGKLEGAGYSDTVEEYNYTDESLPLLGGMAYYRLKQVDFSGESKYSEVVGVRIPSMNITKGVWRAFPNPTSGEVFNLELINTREYNNEELSIRLVTPLANNKAIEGKDLREISLRVAEVLRKSPHGVYILEVNWGQKIEYIKILKKNGQSSKHR